MQNTTMDRRSFLKAGSALAGSLLLGFNLPAAHAQAKSGKDMNDVNAWLRIDPDGIVTIMVPSAEIGQGVFTSAPMLVAEELECDWRQVRAQLAPTDPVYANRMFKVQATASSTSARWSFEPLRRIGATARVMLVEAAASTWKVPVAECHAHLGKVVHSRSGRVIGYGELVTTAALLPRPTEVSLKPPSQWTLIGHPVPRLDIPLKTNGSAVFGVDVQVPGMLIGTVASSPVRGGKLKRFNGKPALSVRGVAQVVALENAVVVLADSYWTAKKGLSRLKPEWQVAPGSVQSTETLMSGFKSALASAAAPAKRNGAPETILARTDTRIEADYDVPYLAHATMEPMNATANVSRDRAEIWGPTQVCGEIAHKLAPYLGLPEDHIVVHSTFAGGGFGRREEFDVFIQAALASKTAKRPVKLIWSREEDIQQDFYRPAAAASFSAVLDDRGGVAALDARLACSSIYIRNFPERVKNGIDPKSVEGMTDLPYALANFAVSYAMVNTSIPVGFWRGVGYTQNCFFFESFLDELAHKGGHDPVAFRHSLLKDKPRHAELLTRLAKRSRWGNLPNGHHLGIALSEAWGSISGTAVELSVDGKRIHIHRIVCAVDCGTAINPATVERQMEGATIWALSAAMSGDITIDQGRIQQSNFHDYPLLGLAQTPAIECELIQSGAKIGGVGESGVPPLAPALCNALFAATGERLRSLPLARHGYVLA